MPDHASHERASRLTGIALMCGAVACFAMLDTTAKYLNLYMSTLQVVWARYTGAFLLPFIVSNPWTRPGLTRTTRPVLQIGRSMLLLGSTLCNFLALRYLQLDEAIALVFSTPFFVAALSGPLLGERVRWRRWTAIAVGFAGVLVVTRPGAGTFHPAALLSLSAAVFYALYSIATRVLARTDPNDTTLFYSNIVGALVLLPVVPFVWTTPSDPLVIALMVAAGAIGQLRPLPPDRGPPAGAGRGVVALHLYRDRAGDRVGLPGVRRSAHPLDADGGRHRGRLRPLHPLP